ncbi:MAG: DUF4261 domain-containing protein [Planctomycetota bacterium]
MTILCFVLLSDDTKPDAGRLLAEDEHTWHHGAKLDKIDVLDSGITDVQFVREGEGEEEPTTGSVFIAPMPAPIEPSDEGNLPGRTLWPEDKFDEVRAHETHWVITSVGTGFDAKDQALMVTQVVDMALRSHPSALGVVWGPDVLRVYGPAFQDLARLHSEDHLPVMLWIGLTLDPNASDGSPVGFTGGMEMFDLMDIECQESPEPPDELRSRLIFLCEYLIENGLVIRDGDTIGESERERLKITYGPSQRDPAKQVMHLSYPDGFAGGDSPSGFKSLLVLLGVLVVVFSLIFGVVMGVRKVASRLFDPAPLQTVSEAMPQQPTGNASANAPTQTTDVRRTESQIKPNPPNPIVPIPSPSTIASDAPVPANRQIARPAGGRFSARSASVPPASANSSPFRPSRPSVPLGAFGSAVPALPETRNEIPRPQSSQDAGVADRVAQSQRVSEARRRIMDLPTASLGAEPEAFASLDRVAVCAPFESPIIAMAYSPDASLLAVSHRGHLRLLQGETLAELAVGRTDASFGRLVCIAFDSASRFVIASNGRGEFRWWRLNQDPPGQWTMERLPNHVVSTNAPATAMAINRTGDLLVSISQTGELRWQQLDFQKSGRSASIATGWKNVTNLILDEKNMRVLLANDQRRGTVDLRNKEVLELQTQSSARAAMSADGTRVVSHQGPRVHARDFTTDGAIQSVSFSSPMIWRVGFIGTEHTFALSQSSIRVWDLSSGSVVAGIDGLNLPRPTASVDSKRKRIAVTSTMTPQGVLVLGLPNPSTPPNH